MSEHEYLIAPNGGIYDLADYALVVTGVGDMPTEYKTTKGYKQHGVTVRSMNLQPRNISFAFDLSARSRPAWWDARARLIDVLRPSNGTGIVTYRIVMPTGVRRDIRGRTQEFSYNEIDRRNVATSFSLFCEDPTFFDPALRQITLTRVAEVSGIAIPISIPVFIGVTNPLTATINNPGTFQAYPKITITGPYTKLAVTNETTGVTFMLGGGGAGTGETVLIDLTPGQEKVYHNTLLAMDEIESGNFVDWRLEPGDNDISVSGVGTSDDTAALVEFYPRYIAL